VSFFLCVLLVGIALFGILYDAHFIRFGIITSVGLIGGLLVLSVKKKGPLGTIVILIGVMTIFISALISTNLELTEDNIKPHLFWWDPSPQKLEALKVFPIWGKLWTLGTGALCLGLGMAFAYRPSLIFVKNRLPFDYPYPIWRSYEQAISKPNANLIPLRSLLSVKERVLLSKYKLILVSIENKRYLVRKDENVPEDCIIIRTKNGNSICGL